MSNLALSYLMINSGIACQLNFKNHDRMGIMQTDIQSLQLLVNIYIYIYIYIYIHTHIYIYYEGKN